MSADVKFIGEVENAIANGSVGRCEEILGRVTELFIAGATQLSDEEVAVFDDVITRLAVEIEISARALLSIRLAPIPNAPPRTIRTLAFDDAIEVAEPVLSQSPRLSDSDLVENARIKGQGHLLAISRRRHLSEVVTDVLVERGDQQVLMSTVENRGAKFSNTGFSILVQRTEGDEGLAVQIGERTEIPPHLFRQLLARASLSVRRKLKALHPELSREIHEVVEEVSSRIESETLTPSVDRHVAPEPGSMARCIGQLDDYNLGKLAVAGAFAEVTSALASMADLPSSYVERSMTGRRSDGLLALARAVGLSWPTVKAILMLRVDRRIILETEIGYCLACYERLRPETAQQILRFYREREKGDAMAPHKERSKLPPREH
jgi:uncharacterized protein (DUF2336 family)